MFVGKWVLAGTKPLVVIGSSGTVGCSPDESAMLAAVVVVAAEATTTVACEVPA
jgi:hypothetical protein